MRAHRCSSSRDTPRGDLSLQQANHINEAFSEGRLPKRGGQLLDSDRLLNTHGSRLQVEIVDEAAADGRDDREGVVGDQVVVRPLESLLQRRGDLEGDANVDVALLLPHLDVALVSFRKLPAA